MNRANKIIQASVILSLGKTAAQITAFFAPIPGLAPAGEILCVIIALCHNAQQNRYIIPHNIPDSRPNILSETS
jgi:hypothetical protein